MFFLIHGVKIHPRSPFVGNTTYIASIGLWNSRYVYSSIHVCLTPTWQLVAPRIRCMRQSGKQQSLPHSLSILCDVACTLLFERVCGLHRFVGRIVDSCESASWSRIVLWLDSPDRLSIRAMIYVRKPIIGSSNRFVSPRLSTSIFIQNCKGTNQQKTKIYDS